MNTLLIDKEHNGAVFTFREDGWFNMTKAAKAFGKQLQNFWNSPVTDEYRAALYFQRTGNTLDSNVDYQDHTSVRGVGTWAHPKLAVFFARWLDVKFSVWCDAVIDDILKGNAEVHVTKAEQSSALSLAEFSEFAQQVRQGFVAVVPS